MPKTRKGPIAPYRVPAHGGDPAKMIVTRAIKRHSVHAYRHANRIRGQEKREAKTLTRRVMDEERDSVALGHIQPGRLREAVKALFQGTASSVMAAEDPNTRVPKATVAEIKAAL